VSHNNKEDKLVDYEVSLVRPESDIDYSSPNYYFVGNDEKMDQFGFVPQIATFQKPEDSMNHLKSLHVKVHINSKPVNNMLVDSRATMNLMPYSLYKKLGGIDEELIKTKRMVRGVGGGKPIPSKGFALMKLTIGRKTLATAIFIAEALLDSDLSQPHCNPHRSRILASAISCQQ
jgi:hypothetical protein